jgi:hypothetical protein
MLRVKQTRFFSSAKDQILVRPGGWLSQATPSLRRHRVLVKSAPYASNITLNEYANASHKSCA